MEIAGPAALFEAPPSDPLAPDFARSTGMERILAQLAALSARECARARLVVRLPAVAPGDAARIEAAIRRYAAVRRADLALRRRALRREGVQTLWLALAFIALCVVLALLLGALGGTGLVADLLRDGLVIAGWVALWRPLDLLLFETWLLRREKRILAAVEAMPVRVEATG